MFALTNPLFRRWASGPALPPSVITQGGGIHGPMPSRPRISFDPHELRRLRGRARAKQDRELILAVIKAFLDEVDP